jgi:imidazolonepropionase-like amidohydrolase
MPMKRQESRVVLRDASVYTGTKEGVIESCDVVVIDGVIRALGERSGVNDDTVVNCRGRWVLPGLIDCHMHFLGARSPDPLQWTVDDPVTSALLATADARKLLAAGFTAVRDAGSRVGPRLREAIASGELVGPRIYTSFLGISRTGGHGDAHGIPLEWVKDNPFMALIADGEDECRRAVRTIARSGADWVKVWATGGVLSERDDPRHTHLDRSELETIVAEAHSVGLPVGAHCEGLEGTRECLRAGVDAIEHGFFVDDDIAAEMAARQVPLVSTLAFLARTAHEQTATGTPEYAAAKAKEMLEHAAASLLLAYKAGAPIAMGTDTFAEPLTPFGRNAEELLALRDAGLPPEECIAAATSTASKLLRLDDLVGTVAVGKRADLIVLGEVSPLDDLGALVGAERMSVVIKDGEIVAGRRARELVS